MRMWVVGWDGPVIDCQIRLRKALIVAFIPVQNALNTMPVKWGFNRTEVARRHCAGPLHVGQFLPVFRVVKNSVRSLQRLGQATLPNVQP